MPIQGAYRENRTSQVCRQASKTASSKKYLKFMAIILSFDDSMMEKRGCRAYAIIDICIRHCDGQPYLISIKEFWLKNPYSHLVANTYG